MSTTPQPKQRGNEIGTTGLEVARNVKRVRLNASMTQQELADRLGQMGRPIPVASIGKIESGARRVEVDDLMALSIALGVTPITLLMPHTISAMTKTAVTGHSARARELWEWAAAAMPLDPESSWDDAEAQWHGFIASAVPWWFLVKPEEQDSERARRWGEYFHARELLRLAAAEGESSADGEHSEAT